MVISTTSNHKRCKSDLSRKRIINEAKLNNKFIASSLFKLDMGQLKSCAEANKQQLQSNEVKCSLKEEILQLQKQLSEQFVIRSELEKASRSENFLHGIVGDNLASKPAKDLIKEISILELEVVYLEKYLLSLYRKSFHKADTSLTQLNEKTEENLVRKESPFQKVPGYGSTSRKNYLINSPAARGSFENPPKECNEASGEKTLEDSCIHRSHSSLSHHSFRTSAPTETAAARAVDSYHSLPLSMLERAEEFSSVSLAEHLGTSISEHVCETPNWLSEEMVMCISAIYCQLSDPPLFNHGFQSSPISFSSSPSRSSPQGPYGVWSPQVEGTSSFNSWLNNPFHSEGSKEFRGSYFRMVEIQGICRDSHMLTRVEHMLQLFRSLVSRLEEIDPRKLKHEEKLAFWINIHNALVMHAFLVYGIPRGSLKRISLVLKAAYNIGGHIISADNIQSTILGCRLPRPGQWLQSLLFPKPKFKTGDVRKSYAIKHPQPLLRFALCSGSHSDPMVRIYTPKSVFQELEVAKEEYVHNNFRIHKEQRVLLPKIVDLYAKDLGLCAASLMDMIEHSMPDCIRKSFPLYQKGKSCKKIEWVPHNFAFGYLLSPDLAKT